MPVLLSVISVPSFLRKALNGDLSGEQEYWVEQRAPSGEISLTCGYMARGTLTVLR